MHLSVIALLASFGDLILASSSDFRIENAQKDISELDVGDLDDMTSEVTPAFLEKLRSRDRLSGTVSGPPVPSGKQQMVFVIMTLEWTLANKKRGTDKLSSDWTTLLSLGGFNPPVYSIDPGRLLIVVSSNDELFELKKFLLTQSDLDFFEVDQRSFFPSGRDRPLVSVEERTKIEQQHGLRMGAGLGVGNKPRMKQVNTKSKQTAKKIELYIFSVLNLL